MRTFRISILAAFAAFIRLSGAVPDIELKFENDLKNTGTLGGEAVFQNAVPSEAATFGKLISASLDLTATPDNVGTPTNKRGGMVTFDLGNPADHSFTISGWFTYRAVTGLPRLFSSPLLDVVMGPKGFESISVANLKKEKKYFVAPFELREEEPYFFAMTFDAASGKFDVLIGNRNDRPKSIRNFEVPYAEDHLLAGKIAIGNSIYATRPFRGEIDEFRVWFEALGQADILAVQQKDISRFSEPEKIDPAKSIGLGIRANAPSGIALVGEKVTLEVVVSNKASAGSRQLKLELTWRDPDEKSDMKSMEMTLAPRECKTLVIPFERSTPDFLDLEAIVFENNKALLTVHSAIMFVEPVPGGLHPKPASFFAMNQAFQDPAGAHRLGVKIDRCFLKRNDDQVIDKAVERVESCAAMGIKTLMVLEADPDPHHGEWKISGDRGASIREHTGRVMEGLRKRTRALMSRVGDHIIALDIQNEPNNELWILGPLSLDEAVSLNEEMFRTVRQELKSLGKNVPIVGIAVSGRDFFKVPGRADQPGELVYTRAVLSKCADAFDIYGGHFYLSRRNVGPSHLPSLVTEEGNTLYWLGEVRGLLDTAKKGAPIWIGEFGYDIKGHVRTLDPAGRLYGNHVGQSIAMIRSVPGVEKLFWFCFNWKHPEYNYDLMGSPKDAVSLGLGATKYPRTGAAAYATSARRLDTVVNGRLIKSAPSFHALRFDRKNGEDSEFVLWPASSEALKLSLPRAVTVTTRDIFYRTIVPGADTILDPGLTPIFVSVPAKNTDTFETAIQKAGVKFIRPVVIRHFSFRSSSEGIAILDNLTPALIQAKTIFGANENKIPLVPGTNRVVIPIGKWQEGTDKTFAVETGEERAEKKVSMILRPIPYLSKPVIDGNLDEWKEGGTIDLRAREFLYPGDAPWKGSEDLSVRASIGWNEDGLYFAAEVTDDQHFAEKDGLADFWKSDSVQIGIDPLCDSFSGYDDNDREIEAVLGTNGAKLYIGAPATLAKPIADDISIKRNANKTVYEIFIKWSTLDMPAPKPDQAIALNFIANENDGRGRAHWMGLTLGIGEGKAPQRFERFLLLGKDR